MEIIAYAPFALLLIVAIVIGTRIGRKVPYSRDSYVCSRRHR